MKHRIILVVLSFFLTAKFFAQTPQGINYQGVARNSSGVELANQNIGLQIAILNGSSSGPSVYTETFNLTTDANGLFSLVIGSGTPVVGTFAGIDWSTGNSKWLQISMDATGGTSYSLIGTSQFVSVPYAQFAKKTPLVGGNGIALSNDSIINTKPNVIQVLSINGDTIKLSNGGGSVVLPAGGGKQTIVLTDNISDAQAAAQITAEFGPNTQEIIIASTTNLTTVNLSMVTKLIKLDILDNTALTSVDLSGLTAVVGEFFIRNNSVLTSVDLSNLIKVTSVNNSQLFVSDNAFTSLSFPVLQKITGNNNYIQSLPSLTSFSFPALQKVDNLTISVCPLVTSITFPALTQVTSLHIGSNSSLSSLSFPVLTSATNNLQVDGNALTSISMPVISTGLVAITTEPSLASISLPQFTSGNLTFNDLSALTSVSVPIFSQGYFQVSNTTIGSVTLPAYASSSGVQFTNNPNLTSISMPVLAALTGSFMACSYNALPSSMVNSLLNLCVSISPPITGKSLYFSNQTPAAPPTGAGLTDKATLISNGNIVQTD